MALSLKNIRYFIAIAEAESITKATQSLHISQSVLTEAMKTLEADLGAPLFQRHARGMVLTHAGHQFLHHAHRILATVQEAQRSFTGESGSVSGFLSLGVTSLVTGYYLPMLLDTFKRAYPNVVVNIIEDKRRFIEHLLVNGELDLGVLLVSQLEDRQALDAEPLVASPWRLWLSVSDRLTRHNRVSLRDLASSQLVMPRTDELEDVTRSFWPTSAERPKVAVRTASIEAVRSFVARGLGISMLPGVFYRPWSLEGGRLDWRPIEDELPAFEVGIAWRRGSQLSPPAESFLRIAREHARSHTS